MLGLTPRPREKTNVDTVLLSRLSRPTYQCTINVYLVPCNLEKVKGYMPGPPVVVEKFIKDEPQSES
jgi:hypothetical protein